MKWWVCACLVFAATFLAAGGVADDAAEIQGLWKPVKAEIDGQPLGESFLKSTSLKLASGKYEVFLGDERDRGTYTLDAAAEPRGMTIVGTDGPNKGRTFPAIYELTENTLRICYDLSGAKRPTDFKAPAGTKLYLVTYLRKQE